MAQRTRVGLVFSYNENWIGGTYYFLNLIHALNLVEDRNKPIISIITSNENDFIYVKNETQYKYLEFFNKEYRLNKLEKGINKILKKVGFKLPFSKDKYVNQLDLIYKYYADASFKNFKNCVFWIPDFQEKFLPQYFKKEEINLRQQYYEDIAFNKDYISFSSNTSLKHFESLFPKSKIKKFVIQFAVTHPNFESLDFKSVLDKYKINKNFFFSPNQFWEHKNHIVVLKALKILKNQGFNALVLFSGKENDNRNKEYVLSLKKYISENNLNENVKFLGFIPRNEQLLIMKKAKAIIQPSFFEGWSTVVEDVKAVNNFILLSDIEAHREQMTTNCVFFNPNNEGELALLMKKTEQSPPIIKKINYDLNLKSFSNDFVNLIKEVST